MINQSTETHVAAAERGQRLAADPTISAWVSASAGSGKTKVLIDRFMRLLLTGTRPQHIICLTYTRAAATEMIQRIMERLGNWAICSPEILANDLGKLTAQDIDAGILDRARGLFARALDCPGGLKIKTFHAFAQEILMRFPLEAEVPPHFTLLTESEAKTLQDAALDHILADPADVTTHAAWTHLVGTVGVEKIEELLKNFMHDADKFTAAITAHGDMTTLVANLCARLDVDPAQTPEEYLRHICADAQLPMPLLRRMIIVCTTDTDTAPTSKTNARLLADWLELPVTRRAESYDLYLELFLKKDHNIRAGILNKKLASKHPELAATLMEEAVGVQHRLMHYHSLRRVATTRAILHLGQKLRQAYQDGKATAAALDFDDIIGKTDSLLRKDGVAPWVLWKLDGGIDHIMIDEAQDTSPTQWRIIRALTEEFFSGLGAQEKLRTIFVVGDAKQSIYSFQHADPEEFNRQKTDFTEIIANAGQTLACIDLNISFRSAPQILRTVDSIFHPEAVRSGVSISPITHTAKWQNKQGYVEVWDVLRAVDEDAAGDWEPRSAYNPTEAPHALLAQTIAERIKKWCAEGQNVAGQHIPVKPGDIMILVRKRNELVQALVRELKERAIPVSGVDRMQLSTQIGVRDLLAVIQFALLPEDDLNLACILRGPLIGMDETTLEDVCHPRPKGIYVWSALRDSAHPVAQTAYAWLDGIRDLADRLTPYDFFTHILTRPCPAGRSGRLALRARLGADATDPIDELLNRAQDFAQRHTPALQNFLCAMQRDDSTIKRDLDHGAGEVRIMTVHAAKGLQAPIVILPDTCSLPQKLPALQWDVVTFLPYYTGGDTKTCDGFADALRQGAQDAQLAEYRRLLYVALTRAENQIYIYGYLGKNESKADHWHKLIRAALCPDREAAPGQALVCLADQNVPGVLGDTPTVPVPTSSASLPEWAFKPAAPESAVRSLSPSQLAADDDAPASPAQAAGRDQAARGRLLHLLLQYLPDFPAAERANAAGRFLARHATTATPDQRAEATAEIMRILTDPRYAPLFTAGSRAEVSIAGMIDGVPFSGQIDRLVIQNDTVMIVDYKTTRPPPAHPDQVPRPYRRQLAAYRALLRQIEPTRTVRCFLLWTYTGEIMELSENDMATLDLAAA